MASEGNIARVPFSHRAVRLQDTLLRAVNSTTVPSGILHRCAPETSGVNQFTGTAESSTASQRQWQAIYYELRASAVREPTFPELPALLDGAARLHARGLVPIYIDQLAYETPTRAFWREIDAYLAEGSSTTLPEKVGRDQLESREVFMAAALLKQEYEIITPLPPVHYGLAAKFVLPAKGYLTNTGKSLNTVEIDFGDGRGYRHVAAEKPIEVTYEFAGDKHVAVRCQTSAGERIAYFTFPVKESVAPPFDRKWPLTGIKPYQPGKTATGYAWVFFGSINGVKKTALTHPVIIAEGFPGGYTLEYLWDRLNQQNLATNVLAAGYDLVILGFDDGKIDIAGNAYVAIACIQKAIAERQGSAKLVVGGASMGGLVTRYALTYMEKNGLDAQTDRYFSVDSPHNGANIAPAVQFFTQYLASYNADTRQAADLLSCPAAQQMLLLWVPPYPTWPTAVGASPLRGQFLNDLRALGWFPKVPRKAGVSDGVGTGKQNGNVPGAKAVWYELSACFWFDLFVTPPGNGQTCAQGCCNKIDSRQWALTWRSQAMDAAPGGLTDVFNTLYTRLPNVGRKQMWYPNSCFIPTISSCAINLTENLFYDVNSLSGKGSDLDLYKVSAINLGHVDLSPELATFLLNFLLGRPQPMADADEKARVVVA